MLCLHVHYNHYNSSLHRQLVYEHITLFASYECAVCIQHFQFIHHGSVENPLSLHELDQWKSPSGLQMCTKSTSWWQTSERSIWSEMSQSQLCNVTWKANHSSDTFSFEIRQQEPVISWSISNCTLACVGGSALNYKAECGGVSSARLLHCVFGHKKKKQKYAAAPTVTGEDRDSLWRMTHHFVMTFPGWRLQSGNLHFCFSLMCFCFLYFLALVLICFVLSPHTLSSLRPWALWILSM